ncbi:MAG: ATP-binding cassette domain-containing protein, partial [Spirochaetales bacterium]|nr:ATP-binding cassette domain-containing protein [Spirochaetales bacterium]
MSPVKKTINQLLVSYPFLVSFLEDNNVAYKGNEDKTLREIVNLLDKQEQEELAINIHQLEENLETFIEQMSEFLSDDDDEVSSITIFPGTDKSGAPEKYESLELKKGEIVCIVGPTGSGKSRLLGDIEWVAQNDTPTKRRVLVNNEVPDSKWRFSISDKLVAQLSQNMNFVMDLSVEEFVTLHAESRMIENIE